MIMYDPPSGWKYGFPKPYLPQLLLETRMETLADTLIRDGYPEHELKAITREDGTLVGVRFFGTPDPLVDRSCAVLDGSCSCKSIQECKYG